MIENNIIDLLISNLEFKKNKKIPYKEIQNDLNLADRKLIKKVLLKCSDNDLIQLNGNTNTFAELTIKGEEIKSNGGWLQDIQVKNTLNKKEVVRQEKTDEILDLDIKLKRFETKIGKKIVIAGIIVTVLSFIFQF